MGESTAQSNLPAKQNSWGDFFFSLFTAAAMVVVTVIADFLMKSILYGKQTKGA